GSLKRTLQEARTAVIFAAQSSTVRANVPAAPSKPQIIRDRTPPLYRASFQDNVRVVQAGAELIAGTEMQVDFRLEEKNSPATKPATHASTDSKTPASAAPSPSNTPITSSSKPSNRSARKSATTQADELITVYWTGPLLVV